MDATDNRAGEWIRRQRQSRGWTMEVLAAEAGTTKASVSRYESGKEKPSRKAAIAIAKATGGDVVELFVAAGLDEAGEDATSMEITREPDFSDIIQSVEGYSDLDGEYRQVAERDFEDELMSAAERAVWRALRKQMKKETIGGIGDN